MRPVRHSDDLRVDAAFEPGSDALETREPLKLQSDAAAGAHQPEDLRGRFLHVLPDGSTYADDGLSDRVSPPQQKTVGVVSGDVVVLRNGVALALNSGEAVLTGDQVQTGAGTSGTITLIDGTVVNLASAPELQDILAAISSGIGIDGALATLVAPSADQARQLASAESQVSAAIDIFKSAFASAIGHGLSPDASFREAERMFWAQIEVSRYKDATSPEQKLLAALADGADAVQIASLLSQLSGPNGNSAVFESSIASALATGASVAEAAEHAIRVSLQAAQANAAVAGNTTAQLALALASGENVGSAISAAGGGDGNAAFEAALGANLAAGTPPGEAATAAGATASSAAAAQAAAASNPAAQLTVALASGQNVGDAVNAAGGANSGAAFEAALGASLAGGSSPSDAAASASETASQTSQANAAAASSPGGQLASALASGQNVSAAIDAAGGANGGAAFEAALGNNLASGASVGEAASAAGETAAQTSQANAAAASSPGGQLVAALASGQNVSSAISAAGGANGGAAFEAALGSNLAGGSSPDSAAAAAGETAAETAQANAQSASNPAAALASGSGSDAAVSTPPAPTPPPAESSSEPPPPAQVASSPPSSSQDAQASLDANPSSTEPDASQDEGNQQVQPTPVVVQPPPAPPPAPVVVAASIQTPPPVVGPVGTSALLLPPDPINAAPENKMPAALTADEDVDLFISGLLISDSDAGGGVMTTTLSLQHGTLTIGALGGATVLGSGTDHVVLKGSLDQINATLSASANVVYRGDQDFNGSDTLTVLTDDGGNTGGGGAQTDTDSVAITVNAVNDAPVNTVAAAQAVDEDTDLTITGLSVGDADSLAASITTTLSVQHGILTVAAVGGASVLGSGTGSVTITGSQADINATLAAATNVVYHGDLNYNGSDTLIIVTDDGGNAGSGGALTDTDSVAITVNAVNDAPVNAVAAAQAVDEDTDLAITGLSVSDVDALAASITTTLSVQHGILTVAAVGGASVLGSGTGSVTITGSQADINATLAASANVVYHADHDYNGSDTLTMSTDDGGNAGSGGALTDIDTVAITVDAVNDAPVNAVAAAQAVDEDTDLAITGLSVSDVDSLGASITTTLSVQHGILTVAAVGGASVLGSGTGSVTITGSQADINATLAASANVVYHADHDYNGSDTLTMSTDDGGNAGSGGALTDIDTVAITVNAVNDAPVNAVAAAQAVDEDTDLAITGLSVSDVDSLAASITTTLSVQHGILTVAAVGGASVLGSGTGSVTITGSQADINATLTASANVVYHADHDYNGSDTLTMLTDDGGNAGSGGALTDIDTVAITVNAVNDAPVNAVAAAQAVDEDTDLAIAGLSVGDVDSLGASITTTLSVQHGILTVAAVGGASVLGSGTGSVTITGSQADINATLAAVSNVVYRADHDYNGADALKIVTDDGGNAGSGGTLTDTDSVAITVNAVNDAPAAVIAQASYNATEQADLTLKGTGLSVSDIDSGDGTMTVTLSVTEGTLLAASGDSGAGVSGSGTSTLTITGTVAEVNALLQAGGTSTLSYIDNTDTPAASATLRLSVNDNGNSGAGGALTGSATSTIMITAVDDAPVAVIAQANYSATEQTSLTLKGTGLSVSDVDAGDGPVTVSLSVGEGTLIATAGDSGAVVAGSGTSTLTITGTVAQVNALMASGGTSTLSYIDDTDTPSASTTLTLSVGDNGNSGTGGALTGSATATIAITAVNDAPVAVIAPATYNATEQTSLTLKGTGLSVGDVDAGDGSMTVTLSVGEGTLIATAGDSGAAVAGSGTSTLTITGTVAEVNALLAAGGTSTLSYIDSTDTPSASTALTMSVGDNGNSGGGALTGNATSTIAITAVNDAPVNTVPAAQVVNEDTDLAIAGLAVSDADASNGIVTTTLSVLHGSLTVASAGGAVVAGSGTATVTLTGSVNEINATLGAANNVVYRGVQDYNGPDTLTVTTDDGGNAGAGGPLRDSDTVAITVNALNDAPVIAAIAQTDLTEQQTTAALTSDIAVSFADVDLPDVGHTASITNVAIAGATAGLTLDATALKGLIVPGVATKDAGSTTGSVDLAFSAASTAVDYLSDGETLRLTYTVAVDDHHGGISTRDFVVTVRGTNDGPVAAGAADGVLTEDTNLTISAAQSGITKYSFLPGLDEQPASVSFNADGDILVSGIAWTNGNTPSGVIKRFLSDGQPDNSFGGGDAMADVFNVNGPFSTTQDGSGRLIAVGLGGARGGPTDTDFRVQRFLADGSVDTGFGTDGSVNVNILPGQSRDSALESIVDSAGNIVVVGFTNDWATGALVRLTSSGALDTSFSGDGIATFTLNQGVNQGNALALDTSSATNRYVVGVNTGSSGFAIGRFNYDGSQDLTFGNNGSAILANGGYLKDVQVDAAGRIYVVGANGAGDAVIARFTPAGILDTSFGSGGSVNVHLAYPAYASGLAFAPDGSLLVSVVSNTAGSDTGDFRVYKFDVNGAAVSAFGTNGSVVTDLVGWGDYSVALAVDPATGRIAVTGPAGHDGGLVIYNADGSLHTSGGTGTLNTTATAQFTDVDLHDVLTATVTAAAGNLSGSTLIQASATKVGAGTTFTFNYSVDNAAVQYLSAGETRVEHFTVSVSDGHGGTASQDVAVTITGKNDAPVNTVTTAQNVNEDTALAITGLSVSDVDAGTSTLTTTLSVADGTLTVAAIGGASVSGSGTATVVVTGTLAQINATLAAANNVVYNGIQDFSGNDTLTIATNDGGNSVAANALTDTDTVAITVNAVNDAPVNAVPAAQNVNEDASLAITGLSVSDVDAGSATVTTTLSVAHGALTVASAGGAAVSGSGTGTVTLTGTLAQINTSLAAAGNVVYKGVQDYNGADTLSITTSDGGGSGLGGARTDTDTVAISVNPVNDAPVVTTEVGITIDFEGIVPSNGYNNFSNGVSFGGLNWSEPSDFVQIVGGSVAAGWAIDGSAFFTPAYGRTPTVVEVSRGGGSFEVLQFDIMAISLNETVTITGSLAGGGVFQQTYNLTQNVPTRVTLPHDAIDLLSIRGSDASKLSIDNFVYAINTPVNYSENSAAVAVSNALTIADVDSATLGGATVWISGNFQAGADLLGFTDQNGIHGSYDAGTGVLTLSGVASLADYQAALRSVTYSNSSEAPSAVSRTISFQVDDGQPSSHASNVGTATVRVTSVNDAPVAVITPASYSATEQTGLTLKGTGLSVSDVDAGNGSMTVTLSVTEGTLLATSGDSGAGVSGSGSSTLTITGTVAQVNALLASGGTGTLSYIDNTDTPSASATLTLTVNDNGNTGGGSLTAIDTAVIAVAAVNDAPSAGNDALSSVKEDSGVRIISFASLLANDLTGPVNEPGQGLTIIGLSNVHGGTAVINGTNIEFTPAANYNGTASFDYTVRDNGQTAGIDDFRTATATASFQVTSVSDAPVGTSNTVATTEDGSYTFTAGDFGFSDANDSPANSFAGVVITTTPAAGILTNNGVAVTAGSMVSSADIAAGHLVFTPAHDGNGAGYASFTFQVQDGGSVSGQETRLEFQLASGWTGTSTAPWGWATVTLAPGHSIDQTAMAMAEGGRTIETDAAGQPNAIAAAGATYHLTFDHMDLFGYGPGPIGVDVYAGTTLIGHFTHNYNAANPAVSFDTTIPVPPSEDGHALRVVFTANSAFTIDNVALSQVAGAGVYGPNLLVNGDFGPQSYYVGANTDPTPKTMTIDVAAVNDAPLASAPSSYNATEQTSLTLKGTGLSISDADAGNGSETVTLSVTEGTLSATAGDSGAAVAGSGTSTLTITGTLAQVSALLSAGGTSTLSYIDDSDMPAASATLTLAVNDNGNAGAGGALSGSATSTIAIAAVNDAPAATAAFYEDAATFTRSTANYAVKSNYTAFSSSAVTVDFFVKMNAQNTSVDSFVSYAIGSGNGLDNELSIYILDSDSKLHVKVHDQDMVSNVPTLFDQNWHHIAVTYNASTGAAATYYDGALVGSITYTNHAVIGSGGTVMLGQEQDTLGGGLATNQALIGDMSNLNVWSRVLSASEIAAASHNAENLADTTLVAAYRFDTDSRAFDDITGHGHDLTTVGTLTAATGPELYFSALEKTPLSLKNAGMTVGDIDGGSGVLTATLSVTEGVIAGSAGNSGVTLSGSGTSALAISGTVAQINSFLGTASTSHLDFTDGNTTPSASVTLTLSLNDNGNTGASGPLAASDTITIHVTDLPAAVTFTGSGGADVISASAGTITGFTGGTATQLRDLAGDTFLGLGGNDTIVAGPGADTITGGGGADTLSGGQSADTFKFAAVTDSTPAAPDIITDFDHGIDTIDLSSIDAITGGSRDAFVFLTNATPTTNPGVNANSITWYQDTVNNQTVIQADTTGDTTADLVLKLSGLHVMTSHDFIL